MTFLKHINSFFISIFAEDTSITCHQIVYDHTMNEQNVTLSNKFIQSTTMYAKISVTLKIDLKKFCDEVMMG